MKKIVFILLIKSLIVFSQNNSGKITYKSYLPKINKLDSTKVHHQVYNDMKEMLKSVQNLEFELYYNSNYSKFSIVNKLENESSEGSSLAKIFYGQYKYFFNFKNKYFIKEHKNNYFKLNDQIKWTLENETKYIDKYLCYKATSTFKFINREGGSSERKIIAWYCPQIPVNIAPENYNGLPGLVLELNTGLIIYVAKNINFYKEELEIHFPNGKLITEEAYTKKLKENAPF